MTLATTQHEDPDGSANNLVLFTCAQQTPTGQLNYKYNTVGSSSNSKSGSINKARARAMRIRHPPEKAFVGRFCISVVKLRPCNIFTSQTME